MQFVNTESLPAVVAPPQMPIIDIEYTEDQPIKYIHFRCHITDLITDMNPNGIQGQGGATAAFKRVPGGVRYALAYCNWTDNFNSRIGRSVAAGRLNETENSYFVQMEFTEPVSKLVENYILPRIYEKMQEKYEWSEPIQHVLF